MRSLPVINSMISQQIRSLVLYWDIRVPVVPVTDGIAMTSECGTNAYKNALGDRLINELSGKRLACTGDLYLGTDIGEQLYGRGSRAKQTQDHSGRVFRLDRAIDDIANFEQLKDKRLKRQ